MTERATDRPRGLAVWAGLDPFGQEIVGGLTHWLSDVPGSSDLAEANRIIPRVALPAASVDDEASVRVVEAIGELLASPLRAQALDYADRDILVPHVWLIADAGSPETESLAPWLVNLNNEFDARQVEARVFLVLRNHAWSHDARAHEDVTSRFRELTEQVLVDGAPGSGRTLVFVVNDRDGIGGRYTAEETRGLVCRFLEFALLSDAAHRPIADAGTAFSPPNLPPVGGWETVPAFASFAAETTVWEAPALFAKTAEERRARLAAALEESAPAGWDPVPPLLDRIDLSRILRWRQLDLPVWRPRFWGGPYDEYAGMRGRVDDWLSVAERWRHDMLVTYEDYRSQVESDIAAARIDYFGQLDDRTRTILRDDSLPGFFSPMRRLVERAQADLHVRRSDLRRQAVDRPERNFTPDDAENPRNALAAGDDAVVRAIERKVNPWLLAQVAVLTALIGWVWLALSWQAKSALWPLILLADVVTEFLARFPFLPDGLRSALSGLFDNPFGGLTTRLALSDVPSNVWLYSALAVGLPVLAVTVFTALRSRVVVERAYRQFFNRARGWREGIAAELPVALDALEFDLSRASLEEAATEVVERGERLEALRVGGLVPVAPVRGVDDCVTHVVLPLQPPPLPLTDLQVTQAVRSFRWNCIDRADLVGDPPSLWKCLFREAAHIAGDEEPDLRRELPAVVDHLRHTAPPLGAVRVRQFGGAVAAEYEDPSVTRFTGAPSPAVAALAEQLSGTVLPMPVGDRFSQVIIQTGLSASWALAMAGQRPRRVSSPSEEVGSNGHRPANGGEAPPTSESVGEAGRDLVDGMTSPAPGGR